MPRSFFEYLLSGVVDYSIWFGSPGNYETNLVMVEAKKTRSLDEGMLSFLGYMGMIHHARKTAKMQDTPVYGIVTDSFRWDFIQIRADSEVQNPWDILECH
ncbi:unnamed protein product [Penicillium roqueforti FM164]|uniref:Genomic scaffold, ProqFM164S04 n=1 Tax=Penicillium roqueforti (strain FM164) TaxID=1365484 RepID=W6QF14_PENRF|nr:unnamed protein product [Penicillium roqueforti FM164]